MISPICVYAIETSSLSKIQQISDIVIKKNTSNYIERGIVLPITHWTTTVA